MKLHIVIATLLLTLQSVSTHADHNLSNEHQPTDPAEYGLGMAEVKPGEILEIPFQYLIQVPVENMDAFWFKGITGDIRLCARHPTPLTPNRIGFVGYCFSLEELVEIPTITNPSKPGTDQKDQS